MPGGTAGARLVFPLQRQEQANWCWAAVTASVSAFYTPSSSWTQCGVADAALGRNDCCTTGRSDPAKCNRPFYLETALDTAGHLARVVPRDLTIAEVQAEMTRGRPVCARIEWPDRSGHFLAVVGCLVGPSGDTYLDIADPIYLGSRILFHDFATSYQTGASWTHSYVTTGAAAGGAALAFNQPKPPVHPDAIGA